MKVGSVTLSFSFQLDIMEPKVPDDIYKTHLENNSKCCIQSSEIGGHCLWVQNRLAQFWVEWATEHSQKIPEKILCFILLFNDSVFCFCSARLPKYFTHAHSRLG